MTHPSISNLPRRGFALISALSIMVLLVMITVGMLTLSTSEVRQSNQAKYQLEAQANARMAFQIALGRLQEYAGPDQRVTATSSLFDSSDQKHLLGVWKSIGHNLSNTNDLSTLAASYKSSYGSKERDGRFVGWLVSGDPSQTVNIDFPDQAPNSDAIPLVGKGALGIGQGDSPTPEQSEMMVHAPLVEVSDSRSKLSGAYSWAVLGENLKARINLTPPSAADESASIAVRSAAPHPASTALKPGKSTSSAPDISEKFVDGDYQPATSLEKALSRDNLLLSGSQDIDQPKLGHYFHDLSTSASGLLTNTKWGGLRKDLSLLSELSALPSSMDLFPDDPSAAPSSRIFNEGPYWKDLTTYMTTYKPFSDGGFVEWDGEQPYFTLGPDWFETTKLRGWQHRMPVLSKLLWLVSYFGAPIEGDTENRHLCMVVQPVIELWNPFNLPIQVAPDTSYNLKFFSFPVDFVVKQGGTTKLDNRGIHWPVYENQSVTVDPDEDIRAAETVAYQLSFAQRLEPGEAVLFSDGSNSPRLPSSYILPLTKGLEIRGGTYSKNLGHYGAPLKLPKSSSISIDYNPRSRIFYTDNYFRGPNGKAGNEYAYQSEVFAARSEASVASNLPSAGQTFSLSSTSIDDPQPTLIVGTTLRTEYPILANGQATTTSEGTLFNPHLFSANTLGYSYIDNNNRLHLETSPYVFTARRVTDYDDIHVAIEDNNSHIGRSHQAEGQTHVPVREVPIQPLTSMAQLQHAGLGHYAIKHDFNPQTKAEISYLADDDISTTKLKPWHLQSFPHTNLAFGNSFASPFTSTDEAETSAMSPLAAWTTTTSGSVDEWSFAPKNHGWGYASGQATYTGLIHDKSWKLNESLWDDWFISSMGDWTNPLSTNPRNLNTVIDQFCNNTAPLANPSYSAMVTDPVADKAQISGQDGYKKLARFIQNQNSFNVNSTSIHAWKTILGSLDLKTHDLPYLTAGTGDLENDSATSDYAVSRFTLPNGESVEAEGDGHGFWQKRWLGARKLTDEELDQLASEVVEQVKLRGPFLSLGEFMNRRLSNDDYSKQGALQTAIENAGLNEDFEKDSVTIGEDEVKASYENKDAIIGKSTAQGAPGYITQADLLMPIAPSLTVRCDTFTIRTYGEARDSRGRIKARAWCEAVVKRSAHYVESANSAETELYDEDGEKIPNALTASNDKYGRKFEVVSFRWLNPQEV